MDFFLVYHFLNYLSELFLVVGIIFGRNAHYLGIYSYYMLKIKLYRFRTLVYKGN